MAGGLVAGGEGDAIPLPPQAPPVYRQPAPKRSQFQKATQQARNTAQQYVQPPQQPQQGMSGVRKGAIGFSLMSGLFPLPFNPLFLPIQMTVFIIMIIVLLFKGYSFWTAALLSWLIPGLIAAVFHYMFLSGLLSIVGYGEAAAVQ